MKKLLIILLIGLKLTGASGQGSPIDKIGDLISEARYNEALQIIDQQLSQSTGEAAKRPFQIKKVEILILKGDFEQSQSLLELILQDMDDPFYQALAQTQYGLLHLNRGRNDLALESLTKSWELFQATNLTESKEAAACLSQLGSVYLATGKYNQAIENELRALQIRKNIFREGTEEIAASYNDLGFVYSFIDNDKALDYYEMALPEYERVHGEMHPKIAQAKTNIGVIYRNIGLFGDAIIQFESALEIWTQLYPDEHPNQAFIFSNLGQTYKEMGNYEVALQYFDKALTTYSKFYGDKHPDISAVLNEVGNIKLVQQDFDGALEIFHQAVYSNSAHNRKPDVMQNPPVQDYYNGQVMSYSLRLKAQALEERYFVKSLKLKDLEGAVSNLLSADSLIDIVRQRSQNENDKIALSVLASDIYEDGVRISAFMSTVSIDSKSAIQAAFYFSEKSKAAVLQEAIADAEAKSFSGIPETLLEEERKIKSSISSLSQQIVDKPSPADEQILREELFKMRQSFQSFNKKLEQEYPNYFNLKYNTSMPVIADLQKILDGQTAVISYYVAERSKKLYLFTITNKRFELEARSLPDDFERNIRGLNNSIFYGDITTYKLAGTTLGNLLIPNLASAIHQLIIIPSDRLSMLSFDVLPTKRVERMESFADMPYLIRDFTVSYEPSAGLLLQKARLPGTVNQSEIFLCAPVKFSNQNLAELPGTLSEVNQIAGLFPEQKKRIVTLNDASEQMIKSAALSSYDYIHFATHGIVDEMDPELSRLYLNSESTEEDGNLFSGEIYNLNLNARLVVLSACETGLGKYSKGEGVIGLSRALQYAGAHNLIVTFWRVADESTARLMATFYQNLLQDTQGNLSQALQSAKLELINSSTYASPYFWAPFTLIGR